MHSSKILYRVIRFKIKIYHRFYNKIFKKFLKLIIVVCIIFSIAFAQIRVVELGDSDDQKYVDACAARNITYDPIGYRAILDRGDNITNCTTLPGIDTMIGKSYTRENVCNKLEEFIRALVAKKGLKMIRFFCKLGKG